jgi:membrane-bound lytic murein transglycosylase D
VFRLLADGLTVGCPGHTIPATARAFYGPFVPPVGEGVSIMKQTHILTYLAPLVLLTAACASGPRGAVFSDSVAPMADATPTPVLESGDVMLEPLEPRGEGGVVDLVIEEPWPIPADWQVAQEEADAAWPQVDEPARANVVQVSLRLPDRLLPSRILVETDSAYSPPLSMQTAGGPNAPAIPVEGPPELIEEDLNAPNELASDDTSRVLAALDPLHDVSYDLPIEVNEAVHTYLEYFQTRMRPTFSRYLIRSGSYIPAMQEIFREYGLPEDLVYIAMIESGFNPYAYSHARASGPWQFIAATGKRYGLRQDYWVDERRNAPMATRAAASYFADLHARFGDWFLAMASYNSGEGRVANALKRNNMTTFWELREAHVLPQETRDYVPKFLAAAIIAKNPEEYGFFIEPHESTEVVMVEVNGSVALDAIARASELPLDEIKFLNPQLRRGLTPPDKKPYPVAIPKAKAEVFAANFPAIQAKEAELWAQKARSMGGGHLVRHKVRSGESLSVVAKKYGSTIKRIQRANKMGRSTVIRAGKTILVPTGKEYAAKNGDTKKVNYKVRRGDSLWKIAARYNVPLKDLMSWNGLKSNSILRPGDRLVVKTRG